MLKLKSLYLGKHFSVYVLEDYTQALLPRVSSSELYKVWEKGDPPPNRCTLSGIPLYVQGAATPDDVIYADDLSEEEWLDISQWSPLKELVFRVPTVQKVFDLKRGSFVFCKSEIYEPATINQRTFYGINMAIFSDLDKYGIIPQRLSITRTNFFNSYVDEEIPVHILLKYELFKSWSIIPFEEKLDAFVPLYRNVNNSHKHWLRKDSLIWTCSNPIELSPEEVRRYFDIETNQAFIMPQIYTLENMLKISLSAVESIFSSKPITIACSSVKGKYILEWGTYAEKMQSCVERIKLKQPEIHKKAHFGFIGCKEDLEKFQEIYGIIKLNKNLLAGSEYFYLHYIEDSVVKKLPGRYAYKKDTYPSRCGLLQKYRPVLDTLTHVLPGDPVAWHLEDLIKYDQLMRTGNYDCNRAVQIGSYLYSPETECMRQAFQFIDGGSYTFYSCRRNNPTAVRIYRKVTILELLQGLKKAPPEAISAEKLAVLLYFLAQKKISMDLVLEILQKVFYDNPSLDLTPNQEEVEQVIFVLASAGVSKEAMVEVLSICLEVSQIDRLKALVDSDAS